MKDFNNPKNNESFINYYKKDSIYEKFFQRKISLI